MNDAEIFIVGANGQLGKALQAKYPNAQSADVDKLDITDRHSVENFDWSNANVILNAAAYTNVDGAETPEGRVAAWKVNASAVQNLTHVAWKHNLTLVHISTDYVFDGTQDPHTEDEPYSPTSVYGQSKAAGDLLVTQLDSFYLLRTSWVIGDGKNFVRTMIELGQKGVNPSVVSDQIGRLTFTSLLVTAIDHLLTTKAAPGVYNVSNDGDPVSWATIAEEVFKLANVQSKVTGVTTEEYFASKPGVAPRPLQSTLDLTKIKATGLQLEDWRTALETYVKKEMQS